jgi:hypothetical protein
VWERMSDPRWGEQSEAGKMAIASDIHTLVRMGEIRKENRR